jgi:hypothetical protein
MHRKRHGGIDGNRRQSNAITRQRQHTLSILRNDMRFIHLLDGVSFSPRIDVLRPEREPRAQNRMVCGVDLFN